MNQNKDFWDEWYKEAEQPWDMGCVSPPLKAYSDQLGNKNMHILLPGSGYGYEACYLYGSGFHNVFVVDIASAPLEKLKLMCPDFPESQLIVGDFFEQEFSDFDLVLEQTFFCAIDPGQRRDYAKKMYDILKPGGKLAGLFFDFPLIAEGPPFGGSLEEYRELFAPLYKIKRLERAYNSIGPRQGKELFFIFEK